MTISPKKCVFDPFRGYICKKAVQKLGNTVLRPIKIVKNRHFLKGCYIAAENQRKLIKIDFVSKSIFEFGPQDFLLPEIGRITFQIVSKFWVRNLLFFRSKSFQNDFFFVPEKKMLETFCSNKTSGAEKTENLRSFFTFFFIFCLVCLKISIVFKNS